MSTNPLDLILNMALGLALSIVIKTLISKILFNIASRKACIWKEKYSKVAQGTYEYGPGCKQPDFIDGRVINAYLNSYIVKGYCPFCGKRIFMLLSDGKSVMYKDKILARKDIKNA